VRGVRGVPECGMRVHHLNATVHPTAVEFDTANNLPTRDERRRYRSVQWSHGSSR
jgi:hypothetical protein